MATSKIIIAACALYVKKFGMPGTVYYPGCGNDSSPSKTFPDSTIVYVDPVKLGLDEIQREHRRAITFCAKAEEMSPGARYDLVIDMHSHAPFEAELRDLKKGGHLLIANKGSDRAFDSAALELVAAFLGADDNLRADTTDLERYVEIDPKAPEISFSNKRKVKATSYVFRKK